MNKKDDVPNFDYFPQNTNANELSKSKQHRKLNLGKKSTKDIYLSALNSSNSKRAKKSSKNFNPPETPYMQKDFFVDESQRQKNIINTSPPPQKIKRNKEQIGQVKPKADVKQLNKSSSKSKTYKLNKLHPNYFEQAIHLKSIQQKSKNTLRRPTKKSKSQKKKKTQSQELCDVLKQIDISSMIQENPISSIQKIKMEKQSQKIDLKTGYTTNPANNLYFNLGPYPRNTQNTDSYDSFQQDNNQQLPKSNQKNKNFRMKKFRNEGRDPDESITVKILQFLKSIDIFVQLINDPFVNKMDNFYYITTHLLQRKLFLQQLNKLCQRQNKSKKVQNVSQLRDMIKFIFEDNIKIKQEYIKKFNLRMEEQQYSNIEREINFKKNIDDLSYTKGQQVKVKLLKKCLKVIKRINKWEFSKSLDCYF